MIHELAERYQGMEDPSTGKVAANRVFLFFFDELTTHPDMNRLKMVAFLANAAATFPRLAGVLRMSGHYWQPVLRPLNCVSFYGATRMLERPPTVQAMDPSARWYEGLSDNRHMGPAVPPIRARLLFWRMWRENFVSFVFTNRMNWVGSKKIPVKVGTKTKEVEQAVFKDPRDKADGYCDGTLLFPPRAQDALNNESVCESLRWKTLGRGGQDHAYLTLLQALVARAPRGDARVAGQQALAQVDRLMWHLPHEDTNADSPYERDARLLVRAKEKVADAIEALTWPSIHRLPDRRVKPLLGERLWPQRCAEVLQHAVPGPGIAEERSGKKQWSSEPFEEPAEGAGDNHPLRLPGRDERP